MIARNKHGLPQCGTLFLIPSPEWVNSGSGRRPKMGAVSLGPTRETRGAPAGFTLIELMIVIAIIALITAISLPGLQRTREDSEDRAMEAEMSSIYKAIVEYAAVNEGRLPASYRELRPFIEVPDFESKYEINPDPFQN